MTDWQRMYEELLQAHEQVIAQRDLALRQLRPNLAYDPHRDGIPGDRGSLVDLARYTIAKFRQSPEMVVAERRDVGLKDLRLAIDHLDYRICALMVGWND